MKLFKGKQLILMIVLLILLLFIGVFAVMHFTADKSKLNRQLSDNSSSMNLEDNGKGLNGEYKSKTASQVLTELQKAQVNVTDKISSACIFNSGTKDSTGLWVVENLPANNVIMQCEIFLEDKLLAKSVPIYPNEHIESIKLLNDIKAGTYDVVAYINYYKLDSKEYISKAGYKIKLTVT